MTRSDEAFIYLWRWDDSPTLGPVDLGHRAVIMIDGEGDGSASVVVRSDPSRCWYVHGWLARDELLRLAAGLPTASDRRA